MSAIGGILSKSTIDDNGKVVDRLHLRMSAIDDMPSSESLEHGLMLVHHLSAKQTLVIWTGNTPN